MKKFNKLKVLNAGFVKLEDVMGNHGTITHVARVTTGSKGSMKKYYLPNGELPIFNDFFKTYNPGAFIKPDRKS